MKAVVFEKKGKLVLTERPRPCLERDTDVLVRARIWRDIWKMHFLKVGAIFPT